MPSIGSACGRLASRSCRSTLRARSGTIRIASRRPSRHWRTASLEPGADAPRPEVCEMYERFFQLRERPFALSPDPEYLYPSKVHQEALSYLRYGVEGHAGFVVITGEIGSGKTTLLQSLLRRLDPNTTVARIVNTMLDPRELLEAILLDFGIETTGMSKPAMLKTLGTFLVQQRQAGRLTILAIDEA